VKNLHPPAKLLGVSRSSGKRRSDGAAAAELKLKEAAAEATVSGKGGSGFDGV
jgi:hypothetical protein